VALDVLAGGEQQLAGVAGRDSEQLGRPGCAVTTSGVSWVSSLPQLS
jgi:hypothetical protein